MSKEVSKFHPEDVVEVYEKFQNDENDVNEVSTLVREKEVLLVELQHYKQSLESIRADTINDCRELNKERLQEKEERIKELKQLNDTVTTDKQYLINEKDERVTILEM